MKKKTHHFRLCANNGGIWGWAWNDTEELPWTPDADVFDAIAKCGWKSNWIVGSFMKWDERKGRFEEFKISLTEIIKKTHPDGAFDVRANGETLISTWLFKGKDGALTDVLLL